jgi:DNA-binding MarR family transcriptional regulator
VIPTLPDKGEGWHPIPLPPVIEGVDEATMQSFLAFQHAVDAHEELVLQDLWESGTQPSQISCLRVIATYEGLCQRDIADILKISRARVTTVVQSLDEAGAIRRVRDENDQRLTRVYLTDFGRELDKSKELLRSAHINAVFGGMSDVERTALQSALASVTQRILGLVRSPSERLYRNS